MAGELRTLVGVAIRWPGFAICVVRVHHKMVRAHQIRHLAPVYGS
jgi:hypothetical protein